MNEPLKLFKAAQVANGWIVSVNCGINTIGTEYVFRTLDELADWLKVQVVRDTAKAE